MSWLTDLAGRAEALLEKVDQTAADSFQRDNEREAITRSAASLHTAPEHMQNANYNSTPMSAGANYTRSQPSSTPSASASNTSRNSILQSRPSDQKLFDFLNSSGDGADVDIRPSASSQSIPAKDKKKQESHTPSRVASRDSLASGKSSDGIDGGEGLTMALGAGGGGARSSTPQMSHLAKESVDSSSVQLENHMLKEEVSALQRELHDWAGRERKSHGELTAMKKQSSQLQADYSQAQKAIQSRENELSSLRRQVRDAEEEAAKHRHSLKSLQGDRQRLLDESVASAGVQHQTLDLVENRLKEAEAQLQKERQALAAAQAEVNELRQKDDKQTSDMAQSVLGLQRQLEQEKSAHAKRIQSLSSSQSEAQRCRQELDDYKLRAARILQAKEQLINKLKDGDSKNAGSDCHKAEIDALREEKTLMEESVQLSKQEVNQLRAEIEELGNTHTEELNSIEELRDQVESQLQDEQRQYSMAEAEHQQKIKEMESVQDELVRQKAALHAQLQEHQLKASTLESKITSLQRSSQSSTRNTEMESRMHSLTDNLLSKQTLVETLSSEKNALLLQLEKARQAASTAEPSSKHSAGLNHHVHMGQWEDGEADAQSRLRPMSSVMPSAFSVHDDAGLARHVRSAANVLDVFSVRLGRFLRHYPAARLMVIVYMILLHIWVTVVLLTYQPEMHGSEPLPGPHPP